MAALPLRRENFEIAIICVLETEGNAVEALFKETFSGLGKAEHDENFYVTGILGGKPVVLVAPRNMGVLNAADAANHMRLSFTRIKLALVTGVAGGAPCTPAREEILLGDVLISTQVLQSDFGRMYAGGIKIREGPADGLGPPRQELANFLKYLLQRAKCAQDLTQRINKGIAEETLAEFSYPGHGNDHLFPREYPHRHRGDNVTCKCEDCLTADDAVCGTAQESRCAALQCDTGKCIVRKRIQDATEPTNIQSGLSQRQLLQRQRMDPSSGPTIPAQIHFGTIASSSQVLKSSTVRDELAKSRNVIGFEMEGAGCWGIFPTIVVKSVCDYADGHKDKQWQPYASAMAACCAREIVEKWQTSQTMTVGLPIPHGRGLVAYPHVTPEQLSLRDAILRGLFVTNPLDDLYAVKQRIRGGLGHAPETCQWIQEHDRFKNWLHRPTPQILSLVGPPGIGKSTLSTTILSLLQDEVPGHPRSNLAFFFCDAAVPERRTYLSVVRSILWQTLSHVTLPTELVREYQMQGLALFTNVQALSRHLLGLFHALGETRILIDGLDEIEQASRNDVFKFFARLAESNVRTILTHHPGRFSNHSSKSPDSFQSIDIDKEWAVRRDVDKFIDAEVSELSTSLDWYEEITTDVRQRLQDKAGGTFLWAALALHSLQNARPDNVLERLENLPPGLDAMYERLLRDIPHRERPTAAFALHCVVAYVPHLTEITFGALLACQETAKSGNRFPSAARIRQLQTAWKSCQVFLRVDGTERFLRSIHQSVEYFFQEKSLPEDLVLFRFDWSYTLSQVTRVCENYLASPTILRLKADIQNAIDASHFASNDQETFESVEHFEFLKFCQKNTRKTRRSVHLVETRTTSGADNALMFRSERDAFWQGVWRLSQQQAVDYEPGLFDLIERASLQLSEIAIASKQIALVNVLEAVSEGWWSRFFGLAYPYRYRTRHTWKHEAEQDLAVQRFVRLLSDLASSGSVELAKTMISHAGVAHGEFVVDQYEPCQSMCALTVKRLISSGDVQQAKRFMNATRYLVASHDYRTYLHCLAEFNVACAVRLLLDAGDEPFDFDSSGNAPLHVAAGVGSFESVKLLFNALPSRLLANDRVIKQALIGAVNARCARSLRLVVAGSSGKKVHRDLDWASLLQRAATVGSEQCLKVLLEVDTSSVNYQGIRGETALHMASDGCHSACIQTLLRFGADPLIEDNDSATAIHRALWVHNRTSPEAVASLWPFVTSELVRADRAKRTLLHGAARHGHTQCVDDCLKWGVDLTSVDYFGRNALHHAAIGGHSEAVQGLLKHDLPAEMFWLRDDRVDTQRVRHCHDYSWEQTPLYHAVVMGHWEIASILVEADASRNSLHIGDYSSKSPLTFAQEMQDLDAVSAGLRICRDYGSNFVFCGSPISRWASDELEDVWPELQSKYRKIVEILEEARGGSNSFRHSRNFQLEERGSRIGRGTNSDDVD